MPSEERIKYLLDNYANDLATENEIIELLAWIKSTDEDDEMRLLAFRIWQDKEAVTDVAATDWETFYSQKIFSRERKSRSAQVVRLWVRVAACLLLVIGGYFIYRTINPEAPQKDIAKAIETKEFDIEPGGNRATLRLADGTIVFLDSTAKGAISDQGGISVINLKGQLAYQAERETTEVLYNTVTTPSGGQYQLILADGTRVWLNAESSLRFPTSFTGKERRVELTGEGYFEVAHQETQPFHVSFNDVDLQVLGTHFNINSYGDEPFSKTTLLQGSVRLVTAGKDVVLKKGQQAQISNQSSSVAIRLKDDADPEQVIAWKNGNFNFDTEHISNIMRQLSRWYDVDVKYVGKIPDRHYTGYIRKSVNVSEVIKMLELAGGVKVTVDRNQLVVQGKD